MTSALATALLGTIMQSTWMLGAIFAVIAGLTFEFTKILMSTYMLDVAANDVKTRSRMSSKGIMCGNLGQVLVIGMI